MEQNITKQGLSLENISQVQDPRILATSYMMYKIGKSRLLCKLEYQILRINDNKLLYYYILLNIFKVML